MGSVWKNRRAIPELDCVYPEKKKANKIDKGLNLSGGPKTKRKWERQSMREEED